MNEQQGMGEYYVDIVMCIDGTSSMRPIIDEVKANALSFYQRFIDAMKENDKSVEKIRIKVIVFRDYGCDSEPMEESAFFDLPEQNDEFNAYVNGIEVKGGGDLPENALEAIALALKSDWTTEGKKKRQAIMVFSDAAALELGARAGSPNYPAGMPADLAELGAWWEGSQESGLTSYEPKAGRLVVFAPNAYPWTDMSVWNRYWPTYSPAGTGLKDVEMQGAIDILVGTIN